MRKTAIVLLISCLAACNRGNQNNDAVRQGVLDYLSGPMGLNMSAMDVKIDSVKFDGEKAKASVSIALKGNTSPLMSKQYDLDLKNGKWVVTGRSGDAGHGATMPGGAPGGAMPGGAMPGAAPGEGMPGNPHGGMAMPPGASGKMPSPEDLPPAGKKK